MADIIDGVVARHVLLLQEIGGMAFAFGKNRDQHIGAGHLLASRRLHVNDGALNDALKTRRRLGVFAAVGDQIVEFLVDIFAKVLLQKIEIDRAGAQDRGGIAIIDQAQQQMLERGVFVMALVGDGERAMERLFEIAGEGRHGLQPLISFP